MSKTLLSLAGAVALTIGAAGLTRAQDTKTTTTDNNPPVVNLQPQSVTVQNADGTYTIVEFPTDREIMVDLTPGQTLTGATGRARVMRHGEATAINLDLSGLPATVSSVNVYTVDPAGKFTLLGPVTIANGVATQTFNTPLDKFMLVLSPNASLTSMAANDILFRSAAPQGLAVVPVAQSGPQDGAAVGERVAATTAPAAAAAATTSPYNVPMLGIPNFRRGTDTHMRVNFPALNDARANVFIEPRLDGPTTIKARFHSLTRVPADKRIVLWAVAPDGKYTKLGQVINTRNRNEAQIQSETALPDFGLLVTLEDADTVMSPVGPVFATILTEGNQR